MTAIVATGISRRRNGDPPPEVPLGEIDLGTVDFWEWDDDRRDGAFATLRRESPITFFEVAEFAGFPTGAGHWALTTYDDVHHASRHPDLFSSSPTSTSLNDAGRDRGVFRVDDHA
jgi:cytochrome P450